MTASTTAAPARPNEPTGPTEPIGPTEPTGFSGGSGDGPRPLERPDRPAGSDVPGLAVRAALVVAAVVAVLVGAPTAARVPLVGLAAFAVTARLVRHRRRGLLDAVLVGTGLLLAVLVVTGLVLDVVPGGITARSWALALGLAGLAALVLTARRPVPPPVVPPRRLVPGLATGVWSVTAAAVVAGALVLSVHSAGSAERAPLQLSVQPGVADSYRVTVTSGTSQGPLSLAVDDGNGPRVVRRDLLVAPGDPAHATTTVHPGQRVTVILTNPGQREPIRSVVVDRSAGTGPSGTPSPGPSPSGGPTPSPSCRPGTADYVLGTGPCAARR